MYYRAKCTENTQHLQKRPGHSPSWIDRTSDCQDVGCHCASTLLSSSSRIVTPRFDRNVGRPVVFAFEMSS